MTTAADDQRTGRRDPAGPRRRARHRQRGVRKAKKAGIAVIAYDRLAEGPIDAYITFDNELVGEIQGRSLLEALGEDASISDKIVMMNGSPTGPNAQQFKAGALLALDDKVPIAKSFDTWTGSRRPPRGIGLSDYAGKYPGKLSRGMRQRWPSSAPPVCGRTFRAHGRALLRSPEYDAPAPPAQCGLGRAVHGQARPVRRAWPVRLRPGSAPRSWRAPLAGHRPFD